MTENMKAFLDTIQNNEDLKKKFAEISNKEQTDKKDYMDEYIALAKDCGITLTKEDFESSDQELSDEDLENVSGGFCDNDPIGQGILEITAMYRKLMEEEKAKQSGSGQNEKGQE